MIVEMYQKSVIVTSGNSEVEITAFPVVAQGLLGNNLRFRVTLLSDSEAQFRGKKFIILDDEDGHFVRSSSE